MAECFLYLIISLGAAGCSRDLENFDFGLIALDVCFLFGSLLAAWICWIGGVQKLFGSVGMLIWLFYAVLLGLDCWMMCAVLCSLVICRICTIFLLLACPVGRSPSTVDEMKICMLFGCVLALYIYFHMGVYWLNCAQKGTRRMESNPIRVSEEGVPTNNELT